jgi:6-phosphofructokinase 1
VDAPQRPENLAVLTSGGDAPGMNAAVRAVVRTGLHHGVTVHAVHEGYRGLVLGGDQIRPMKSRDVGGILHQGGTVIGTARSPEFLERDGRRQAARHLVERGIDGLVVIGGDGSLTGADLFRREWPELLDELVEAGELDRATAEAHPQLRIVGLVGSIDNDMFGTDMTIGADTALHRITAAVDAIRSTAASHQRSFVIEVMGRHCGYLALMSALATAANFVFIPEQPPSDDWAVAMCERLRASRASGRRQNLVIVAEGAHDRSGAPISTAEIQQVLETELGEDARVTILGHVQRGGAPSAFDRYMTTLLGYAAVTRLLTMSPDDEPELIGIREHEIVSSPLMACVEQTRAVAEHIRQGDYATAMKMRGGSFVESYRTFDTLIQAEPRPPAPDARRLRLAVMHAGGPAPGMNTAVRAAVRLGLDAGHTVLGVRNGFRGLRDGDVFELGWMSVDGWASRGGAELGTSRFQPAAADLPMLAGRLAEHEVDGLLVIGGWDGYAASHLMARYADDHPEFAIPMVCLPASINNDLPGSEVSIGSDTALNAIASDVDKIKQSAVAYHRSFVVEVMGRECGYLALMSGLSTGAERIYLPEEGITLDDLRDDVVALREGFERGKRLGLVIRSEHADATYTTAFIHALFEREGGDLFDVRQAVLGHVQQGGDPTPFDRIQATRLASRCLGFLADQAGRPHPRSAFIGLLSGKVAFTDLDRFPDLVEPDARRPREQPWLRLRDLAEIVA